MLANGEDAKAWKARWKRINEFEIEELRRTPPAIRLRQFFSLMAMGKALGFQVSTPEDNEAVRLRWLKLREFYNGRIGARNSRNAGE